SLVRDELPMWGTYGGNYSGIAIGFRPTAIIGMPARVQKVNYLNASVDQDFTALALDIARQFDASRHIDDPQYWYAAGVDLITSVTAVKHTTWAYEQEVRMIYVQAKEPPKGHLARVPIAALPGNKEMFWTQPLERTVGSRRVQYL